jgi:putative ABC transport system permease protein
MFKLVPLAFRSLIRNRRRSAFTLMAITLGVAVVVFANGFGRGLAVGMVILSVEQRVGALQVHRLGYLDANEAAPLKLDLPDDPAFLEKIAKTPGVKAVARRIRFGGMLNNGARSSMIMGLGLDPVAEFAVCPDRRAEVQDLGTHLKMEQGHGAVLGGELARSYGVKPGDTLTVTAASPKGAVNALDLDVIGITRGAAPMESKRSLTVPLAYAQELLQMEGRVTEYAVAVNKLSDVPEVKARLQAALGPDVEVSAWNEVMPFLQDIMDRLRIILGGITVVLFVMVVFGVVNTMLMSVFERVREIGTMMAVGLKRRQVMTLFLLEAGALGTVGGLVGAALGFAINAYYAVEGVLISPPGSQYKQMVRPDADPWVAVLAVVVAILGAVLAAAYPARKASLMHPVEALRTL